MAEAPVEFVHRVSVGVEPIHGVVTSRDGSDFTPMMRVLQGLVEQLFFPTQPFKGCRGLVDPMPSTTPQGLAGDGAGVQVVGSQEAVAGRHDRHLLEGVKAHFSFELPL